MRNDPERHTILHVACCTLHVSPSVQRCMRCPEPCCSQAIQWCLCLKASPQRCMVQVRLCFVHHKTTADPVASEVRRRCASHRIASHRIASHRIASHRIASHRCFTCGSSIRSDCRGRLLRPTLQSGLADSRRLPSDSENERVRRFAIVGICSSKPIGNSSAV